MEDHQDPVQKDIQEAEATDLAQVMENVHVEEPMEGTSEAEEGTSDAQEGTSEAQGSFRTGLLDDSSDSEEEYDDHDDEASPNPMSYNPEEGAEDQYNDNPTVEAIVDEVTKCFGHYGRLLSHMMGRGILRNKQKCPKCNRRMILQKHHYVAGKEWKCPSASKKTGCSTVSVKRDSWFQEVTTPATLRTVTHFMIMFTKKCRRKFIKWQLEITQAEYYELLFSFLTLVDRIIQNYEPIGGRDKEVYLEIISIDSDLQFLAGYEYGSTNCFVRLLQDDRESTLKRVKKSLIVEGSDVYMDETPEDDSYEELFETIRPTDITDEMAPWMFFRSLREKVPDPVLERGPDTVQTFLNDNVVRKQEGLGYLNACFKEIIDYL